MKNKGFSEIWVIVILVLAIVLFVAWRENVLIGILDKINAALEKIVMEWKKI